MNSPQFIISTKFCKLKRPILTLDMETEYKLVAYVEGTGEFTFAQFIYDKNGNEVFSATSKLSRENVLKELAIFRKYFADEFDIVLFSSDTTQEKVKEFLCEATKN